MSKEAKVNGTLRQRNAFKKVVENGGNVSRAMIEVGYSPNTAHTPSKLTDSEAWKVLTDDFLSDKILAEKHKELLDSTRIDHLVFPLGPKGEDDINLSGGRLPSDDEEQEKEFSERTTLTDAEIIQMLAEVNCKVRRIVHGQTARHVYFWSFDNKARKEGLDMAYKLKGKYAPEKSVNVNIEVESSEAMIQLTEKLNEVHRGTSFTGNGGAARIVDGEIQDKE